ncbi:Hypothetical predicted protein [Marmota monax]|uniref:Uncharacterized protein n=1 Tax=Marmota monax TaxID=9995 RepID=A0A5E4CT63_MARMO|nr:Hypothetical predicted protein [Marmota monax]
MKPCRHRLHLWAALSGATLIRDCSGTTARCPDPRAQAAAATALRPSPPEHGSPRRGMQNDPRAGSARRCSGEQATQVLEAAVQPSEDRARHAAQLQPLDAAAGQYRQSHQDSNQKANGGSHGVDFRHRNHSPANNPNPQSLPV